MSGGSNRRPITSLLVSPNSIQVTMNRPSSPSVTELASLSPGGDVLAWNSGSITGIWARVVAARASDARTRTANLRGRHGLLLWGRPRLPGPFIHPSGTEGQYRRIQRSKVSRRKDQAERLDEEDGHLTPVVRVRRADSGGVTEQLSVICRSASFSIQSAN